jgi:hypothetical protein
MADELIEKAIRDWRSVQTGGSIDAFRDDLVELQRRDGNSQPGHSTKDFEKDRNEIVDRLLKDQMLPNVYFEGVVRVKEIHGDKTVSEKDEVLVVDPEASDTTKKKIVLGLLRQDKFGILRVDDLDRNAATQLGLFAHPGDPMLDIKPNNVVQSDNNPNCHFAATLTDLAKEDPDSLRKMVKDNTDGTYTVTLPGDAAHPITVEEPNRWELETFGNNLSGNWAAVIDKAVRQRNHTPFGSGGDPVKDEQLLTGKPSKLVIATSGCGFPASWIDAGGSIFGSDSVCPDFNKGKNISSLVEKTSGKSVSVLPTELPRLLSEAMQKHMLIVASHPGAFQSNPVVTDSLGKQVLLEDKHGYSVMSYDPSKQTFMLRNPWGKNRSADGKSFVEDGGYIYVRAAMMGDVLPALSIGETSKTKR